MNIHFSVIHLAHIEYILCNRHSGETMISKLDVELTSWWVKWTVNDHLQLDTEF